MKKIIFIGLILLGTSCEEDTKFTHEILGKWLLIADSCQIGPGAPDIEDGIIFEFKANGVFNEYDITGKVGSYKYRINDSIVTLIISDSEIGYKYLIDQNSLCLIYVDTCNVMFVRSQ